jgi:hypothetical protein
MIGLGAITGTRRVRPASRGYKYTYQYEKYYLGQLRNVKNLDDHFKWTMVVVDALKKGHLTPNQLENVLAAGRKRRLAVSKKR